MVTTFSGIRSKAARLAPILAVLLVAACAPQHSAPTQTQATNPSVTYKYRGDEELVQANDKAMAYCSQYHSTAQTARIDTESDGSKTAVFQCVAMPTTMASSQIYNPNYPYNYNTDQVQVPGPVNVTATDGYHMVTNGVGIDLKARKLAGAGGVSGAVPSGEFSADRMSADLDARTVVLEGRAHLRMTPGKFRMPK